MQEHLQGWRPEEAGGQLREQEDWNRNKTYTLVLSVHSCHPSRLWDLKSFKKISVGDSEYFFLHSISSCSPGCPRTLGNLSPGPASQCWDYKIVTTPCPLSLRYLQSSCLSLSCCKLSRGGGTVTVKALGRWRQKGPEFHTPRNSSK